MINVVLSLQSKLDEANKHVLVERQCQANGQYSRRGCLDVQAFPVKWMRMFWKRKSSTFLDSLVVILCKLKPTIESAKKVTVKFRKRKDCQQVWSVKKDMQKIKMEDVNFLGKTNFLLIEALVHITKYCGPRAKNYIVQVKFSVFTFPVTQSRSRAVKTIPH